MRCYKFNEPPVGSVAERSKALVLGTSPKGRGFESHHCQIFCDYCFGKLILKCCSGMCHSLLYVSEICIKKEQL